MNKPSNDGKASRIKIPMITSTTINSVNVKPFTFKASCFAHLIFDAKISGKALMVALVTLTITSIITIGLVAVFLATNSIEIDLVIRQEAKLRLESALNQLISLEVDTMQSAGKDMQTPWINKDSVLLRTNYFGVFKYGYAVTWYRTSTDADTLAGGFLMGSEMPNDYPALYQFDSRVPLYFAGTAHVDGNVLVSPFGIQKAVLGGAGHDGVMVTGKVGQSVSSLPQEPFKTLVRAFDRTMRMIKLSGTQEGATLSENYTHTFAQPTLVLNAATISLRNRSLSGNILLYAEDELSISEDCHLDGIILVAPKIEIGANVSGNFQALATESVVVHENAKLFYPSFLVVYCPAKIATSGVVIHENALIEGGITFIDDGEGLTAVNGITIEKDALVRGQVSSQGFVDLQGEVHGQVVCHTLQNETLGTLNKSALLNGRISSKLLPPFWQTAYAEANTKPKLVLRWLHTK
jgi:hypothetical protein